MALAPKKPDEKASADAPAFKKLKVSALGEGHYRSGLKFGKEVTEVNADDMDDDKLQAIINDPRLKVEKV